MTALRDACGEAITDACISPHMTSHQLSLTARRAKQVIKEAAQHAKTMDDGQQKECDKVIESYLHRMYSGEMQAPNGPIWSAQRH